MRKELLACGILAMGLGFGCEEEEKIVTYEEVTLQDSQKISEGVCVDFVGTLEYVSHDFSGESGFLFSNINLRLADGQNVIYADHQNWFRTNADELNKVIQKNEYLENRLNSMYGSKVNIKGKVIDPQHVEIHEIRDNSSVLFKTPKEIECAPASPVVAEKRTGSENKVYVLPEENLDELVCDYAGSDIPEFETKNEL